MAIVLGSTAVAMGQVKPLSDRFWITDGTIRDVAEFNGTLYAAGNFTYVGPKTGSIGVANSTSGELAGIAPSIQGTVWTIVADGEGGWFVGGAFTNVGGLPRTNLVRLRADLSIDPTVYPALTPKVYALALVGTNLAVGGSFQTEAATNLILLSSETGKPLSWQPHPQSSPAQIRALAVSDGKFYAPEFASISGYIAVIDPQAHTRRRLAPDIGGSVANAIYSLAVNGNTLFFGGKFSRFGFATHGPVAAIDLQTETLLFWDPLPHLSADYYVSSIVTGTNGTFVAANRPASPEGIRPVIYDGVAWAFDSVTLDRKWTNSFSFFKFISTTVNALGLHNDKLFVGGDFIIDHGQLRRRIAALDPETGELDSWVCHANGNVNAFAVAGDRVAFGGQISSAGGLARENLAAFDIATGAATDWKPITEPNTRVNQIQVTEHAVIVGGWFRKLNGIDRVFIGALDRLTGATLVDFNAQLPRMEGFIQLGTWTLALAGESIYFGGYFTNSSGFDHKYIAAIDLRTLEIKSGFNPILNGGVQKIITSGNVIYAAGEFTQANGLPRFNLVALDGETGEVLPWAPVLQRDSDGTPAVTTIAIHGSTFYFLGTVTKVNGETRFHSAAVDLITGETLPWSLPPEISMYAPLLPSANALFLAQGSVVQAYDYVTGAKFDWEGQLPGLGYRLIETENAIIASGDSGIALFPKTPAIKAVLQPDSAGFSISAMPGQLFSIDASPDLSNWAFVLKTNALLKEFVGPPLRPTENRFYRITATP